MKHWIKRSLIGALGATLLVGSLSACSHHGDSARWSMSEEDSAKMRGKMIERVSSKLDLNADQKQHLVVLGEKLHAQRLALMGKDGNPRAEMQALVAGDKFDRSRAQAWVTDKTAILNQHSPEVIAALADFYDSLNPTQQQQVREFMQRRRRWG
jgi:Spy/CpxP family protein refolding chaperone